MDFQVFCHLIKFGQDPLLCGCDTQVLIFHTDVSVIVPALSVGSVSSCFCVAIQTF